MDKIKALKYIQKNFPDIEVSEIGTDGLLLSGDKKEVKKAMEDVLKKFNISYDNVEFKEAQVDMMEVYRRLAKACEIAYKEIDTKLKNTEYGSIEGYVDWEINQDESDPKVEKIFLDATKKAASKIEIPENFCDVVEAADLEEIDPYLKLKNYNKEFMDEILSEIAQYFDCDYNY